MSRTLHPKYDLASGVGADTSGGIFCSDWKWPDIPNRECFKGEMLHSAAWPKGATMKDKRVAVIGVGSTGVQIVPNIEPGEYDTLFISAGPVD